MKFCAYYRVSTIKQEHGINAQKRDVHAYVMNAGGELIGEYSEKESGKKDNRPQMLAAIQQCKDDGATLIFAKLDRLSRDASFIFTLKKELDDAGVKIVCVALPDLNTLTLGIFATMAQHEREVLSSRTKAGLESVRLNGSKSGKPIGRPRGQKNSHEQGKAVSDAQRRVVVERDAPHMPMIWDLVGDGLNLADIARKLNLAGRAHV